jgi:O-antigen/teichoic acid export membrane protein
MSLQKHTLWSVAPLLVATVVNLVSVPRFLDYLGPDMYALWSYVLTFTGAFGFMDLGLGVAVGRYVGVALAREDRAAVTEYWGTGHAMAVPLLVAMAIGFTFAGVWFGPAWFKIPPEYTSLLRWSFVAGGTGVFLSYYGQMWYILAQAHLDFAFLSQVRIVVTLLTILPSIYLAKITRSPLVLLSWAACILFVQVLWLMWRSYTKYELKFHFGHFRRHRLKEMTSFTAKTFVDLIVGAFFGASDRLILGRLAPLQDFTYYSVATNIGNRLNGVSVAVMGPVFHNTSRAVGRETMSEAATVYNSTFQFIFGWFLLATLWSAVWAKPALVFWLGTKAGTGVLPVFTPLLAGYALLSMSNIAGAQLGPLNRIGTGLMIRIVTTILTMITIWLGWSRYGIEGAAWGFFVSRCFCLAQDFYVIQHIKGGGWLSLQTWKHAAGQAAYAACWGLLIHYGNLSHRVQLFCAAVHGGTVAYYLLRQNLKSISR